MATVVSGSHSSPSRRDPGPRTRPSGVSPRVQGSAPLPRPARTPASLRLAPATAAPSEEAEWRAAFLAAKQRVLEEEEERAWQAVMARARAAAEEEEREWAALRARAAARAAPRRATQHHAAGRFHTWP